MAKKVVQSNSGKATPKQLVTAKARNLHISPRKMRLVTNLVKDMRVSEAMVQLQFANKKAAPMVVKLLQSAVANAVNNFSLNSDVLFIKSITTDMGPVLKRVRPRARGSAFVIRRKLSHVNVVLEERGVAKLSTAKVKSTKADAKDKALQTSEDNLGKPVETQSKAVKPARVKETHQEKNSKVVEQKQSARVAPRNTRSNRTTNK
ncbi:MAG: 50S ribosomal protein L22 [Candidatus Doudnabacteria bacterium]